MSQVDITLNESFHTEEESMNKGTKDDYFVNDDFFFL